MTLCKLTSALTATEQAAVTNYRSDSTFFHAVAQGWSEPMSKIPAFMEFAGQLKERTAGLDSALLKSTLVDGQVLYSGHSRGSSIFGAMAGDMQRFVGLSYRYPGYVSTSTNRDTAILSFLTKRAAKGSRPTLLTFHLPSEFNALDMSIGGQGGEFEYLLGRGSTFTITNVNEFEHKEVEDPILELTLKPDF